VTATPSPPYPPTWDPTSTVRELLPGSLSGDSITVAEAWLRPLSVLDRELDGLAIALDPDVASGYVLELLAARYGETRSGLTDDELRAIVRGRVAADASRGLLDGVWRAWLALTGATSATARIRRLPSPAPTIRLEAQVPILPRRAWLDRASAVLRVTVAEGVEVYGILSLDYGLELGPSASGAGLDNGALSALVQPSGV
jgi:hypothetical protein